MKLTKKERAHYYSGSYAGKWLQELLKSFPDFHYNFYSKKLKNKDLVLTFCWLNAEENAALKNYLDSNNIFPGDFIREAILEKFANEFVKTTQQVEEIKVESKPTIPVEKEIKRIEAPVIEFKPEVKVETKLVSSKPIRGKIIKRI